MTEELRSFQDASAQEKIRNGLSPHEAQRAARAEMGSIAHGALAMQTPASRSHPSLRRYNPNPPRWAYPEGAWVLKIDCQGKLDLKGKKMAPQQSPCRRGCPATSHPTAPHGLLLLHLIREIVERSAADLPSTAEM
jgi:hypothetical protein